MEDRPCFDLEKSLLAWKQDCASHPGVFAADARELESHLRDCIAELRGQGMSEEEAFCAALRQVGPTPEIAREFARENPLGVWRDRVFWMAVAALAYTVWHCAVATALGWVWNLGDLLPALPHGPAWYYVFVNLPVLVVGALLASGRLGRARGWLGWCMQSRLRFVCTGATCMIAAMLMQFPSLWQGSWSKDVFLFLDLSLGPTFLLAIGTALLRPLSLARWAGSAADPAIAPASVWRDRVFWMVAAGLLTGFWQNLNNLAFAALFYTVDINRPWGWEEVLGLMIVYRLILVGPVVLAAGLGVWHLRRGGSLPSDVAPARRSMLALAAVMLCAWVAATLWYNYICQPEPSLYSQWTGLASSRWGRALIQSRLQWLWPAGLGVLAVYVAPVRRETREGPQPIPE